MLTREHARANAINGATATERRHCIENHFRDSAGRATVVGGITDPAIHSMIDPVRRPAGRFFLAHG